MDAAVKIKGRLAAKLKGEEYTPPAEVRDESVNWSKIYTGFVVGAGILAACIGVVGFVRKDDLRLSGATVGVGVAAVVFQYVLLLAAAVILILLIGIVIYAMDGGF